ncbi:MAG TPA: hypothetical protein DCP69_03250 [Candidatus Omnitrophica bacterium]|nr:hypothetical protein [Candidatus Omnitrophota bacterium]
MSNSPSLTDHDLLIRIDERVRVLKEDMVVLKDWHGKHEKAHAQRMKRWMGVSAALGGIAGFFASIFRN